METSDQTLSNKDPLVFTGERYLPELSGGIQLEHTHRYVCASQFVTNKRVLDIACGEGYGSAYLAAVAADVVGVDIAPSAVAHAIDKYKKPNLRFSVGSCSKIPLQDSCVDVIVSFETIEHHDEHEAMMREFKRVLVPGGLIIISSPDKYEYSDVPNFKNEYHVKELYRDEFQNLIKAHFSNHVLAGQKLSYGSSIFSDGVTGQVVSHRFDNQDIKTESGVAGAVYFLAFASDNEIPEINFSFFAENIENSDFARSKGFDIEGYKFHIAELEKGIAQRDQVIADVYASHSWRVTAVLRKISMLFK